MTPAEKQHGLAVPRSFEFHWAGGQIIEEASYTGQYTEPAIQLLEVRGSLGRLRDPLLLLQPPGAGSSAAR